MKRQFVWLILYVLLCIIPASAQIDDAVKITQIKSDPNYCWELGEGENRETALHNSDQQLIEKIAGVYIRSDSYLKNTIESSKMGGKVQSEFIDEVRRSCNLYLRGLGHLTMKEGDSWYVLAYIHKDSLSSSQQYYKSKLRDYYQKALYAERDGRLSESLRYLYWGYLLSQAFKDTLELALPAGGIVSNPYTTFETLVGGVLHDVKFAVGESFQDGSTAIVPIYCVYNEIPVSELYFQYSLDDSSWEWGMVEEGKADLPFDCVISSPEQKIYLSIEYAFQNEMTDYDEVQGTYEIIKGREFRNTKQIPVFFPWITETPVDTTTKQISLQDTIPPVSSPDIVTPAQVAPADTMPPAVEETVVQPDRSKTDLSSQPEAFRDAVDYIKSLDTLEELQDVLSQYVKLGEIVLLTPDDLQNSSGAYVIALDGQKIADILFFDGEKYCSLKDGKNYADLDSGVEHNAQLWFRAASPGR